jgi:methionyl-tRNA synthetase
VNKDLADVFGNLVNRILVFSSRTFGGRIPAGGQFGGDERALANEVTARLSSIRCQHEQLDFRRAAAETRALWVLANTFLQRAAPWSAGADRAAVITRVTLNLVRLCAIAAHSIVPSLSDVVLDAFDDRAAIPHWPWRSIAEILDGDAGHAVNPIGRLVEKLSDADASRLKRRFGDSDKRVSFGP